MTGYVLVCSKAWTTVGTNLRCTGTLKSVSTEELAPAASAAGLSAEDWGEFRAQALLLFAIVFGFLALKKALS